MFTFQDARVVNFDPVSRDVYFPSKEELMSDYRIIVTTLVTAGRYLVTLCLLENPINKIADDAV